MAFFLSQNNAASAAVADGVGRDVDGQTAEATTGDRALVLAKQTADGGAQGGHSAANEDEEEEDDIQMV